MIFPMRFKADSFLIVPDAKYGSRRDKGKRSHAGCDLYCAEGTPILAMEDGKVINSYLEFYGKTGAVEISGSYMIRYAEIIPYVKDGDKVVAGQVIGEVKLCEGIKQPMLHLEMYSEKDNRFPLTNRTRLPFMRRSDLINPTDILKKLLTSV